MKLESLPICAEVADGSAGIVTAAQSEAIIMFKTKERKKINQKNQENDDCAIVLHNLENGLSIYFFYYTVKLCTAHTLAA